MKFLFDLFPVILFFAAFKFAGIYVATAVTIAATFAQIGWVWWKHRRVDAMLWVSLGLVVVLGGATLLLHDETFIKWKPTVLYWLFAIALLAAPIVLRKNLVRKMFEEQFALPEPLWNRLNLAWVAFFCAMGFINLFVAAHYPTDTWVTFKLFGGMGLMLAFLVAQFLFLAKYIEEAVEAPLPPSSSQKD